MPETKQRLIVDGVEFGQVFLFPQIFRAVTWAFGPSRLIIALFMVIALVAMGRLWDAVTQPNVHPTSGLEARATVADQQVHQEALRDGMRAFAPNELGADELDTDEALRAIRRGYEAERQPLTSDDAIKRIDARYDSVIHPITDTRPRGDFEATVMHVSAEFDKIVWAIFELNPTKVAEGAVRLFVDTPRLLWTNQTWFAIFYGLVFVAVLAIGGGALSRMAALHFAAGEQLRMREAIDFAISRWGRLVWAIILPLMIASVLAVAIVMMGLLMEVPVLDVIGGLIYGLALLVGFLVTFLLLGYWLGFPMLLPAVASENCDGADAMQRAYAYVVSRPLHLLCYWVIALVGLALGFMVVSVVASLTLNVTKWLFGYWTNNPALIVAGVDNFKFLQPPPEVPGPWHSRWAGAGIAFWQALVVSLIGAYVIAYSFGAATIMYLLMRRASDGQDMQEIWRADSEAARAAVPTSTRTKTSSADSAALDTAD
ncbi:MAG: hypothetical protein L0Y42_04040 [Phycisphaerales bacterium]|nr:hypothetical protein [Phycisphaerales bacterium]